MAKTQHNEVAPAQFEIAPIFSTTNLATDQNQLTMELIQRIAKKHNLVALLHEKPFEGINGSGKHRQLVPLHQYRTKPSRTRRYPVLKTCSF